MSCVRSPRILAKYNRTEQRNEKKSRAFSFSEREFIAMRTVTLYAFVVTVSMVISNNNKT